MKWLLIVLSIAVNTKTVIVYFIGLPDVLQKECCPDKQALSCKLVGMFS